MRESKDGPRRFSDRDEIAAFSPPARRASLISRNELSEEAPSFAWKDDFLLGHDAMDATHRDFVKCVDTLLRVDASELAQALDAFEIHAHQHFAEEDQFMLDSKYESAGCHIDEHAAVLKSLTQVREALESGRPEVVRSFARALADWFPQHASFMDQGLARWMISRALGGSPIRVLRNSVSKLNLLPLPR